MNFRKPGYPGFFISRYSISDFPAIRNRKLLSEMISILRNAHLKMFCPPSSFVLTTVLRWKLIEIECTSK